MRIMNYKINKKEEKEEHYRGLIFMIGIEKQKLVTS